MYDSALAHFLLWCVATSVLHIPGSGLDVGDVLLGRNDRRIFAPWNYISGATRDRLFIRSVGLLENRTSRVVNASPDIDNSQGMFEYAQ